MKILPKSETESSRAYAFRVLQQNIVSLELEPGAAISENEISSQLALSRTPVREALIELSKNGLVEIRPQRGSYISKIDYQIIEESKFVRLVLELAIIRLACVSIPREFSVRLNDNIAQQVRDLDQDNGLEQLELDNEFHHLLFSAVGKDWSYNLIRPQMVHFDRLRMLSLKTLEHSHTVNDHCRILQAIEGHDRDLAERLITEHLSRHTAEKEVLTSRYPTYFV